MPNPEQFPAAVEEILNSAYWRINVRPAAYERERLTFEALETTLQRAQVRLRGWYFPHLSNRAEEIQRGANYLATWSNFANYEYWRFYQSAQLIHYHGVREVIDESYRDTLAKMSRANLKWRSPEWDTVKGYIDIINFLYTITEVFEFAARLASNLDVEGLMRIEIALENIDGFILGVSDPGRAWHELYQWNGGKSLSKSWDIEAKTLAAAATEISLEAALWFFARFGWTHANAQSLRSTQLAFFKR